MFYGRITARRISAFDEGYLSPGSRHWIFMNEGGRCNMQVWEMDEKIIPAQRYGNFYIYDGNIFAI